MSKTNQGGSNVNYKVLLKLLFCVGLVSIQACSIFPKKSFVPADPEAMSEWSIEGSLVLEDDDVKQKTFFTYQNIDGDYELTIRPENPVERPEAIVRGNEDDGASSEVVESKDPLAERIARMVKDALPLEHMSYWLRGLPATASADFQKTDDDKPKSLKEAGWEIEFDGFMEVGQYRLPENMSMKKGRTEVDLDLVRAETAFIKNPCPNFEPSHQADLGPADGDVVSRLVPENDSAPLPRYINENDFCQQLFKVHGKMPDLRVGLYGPDSMMWKLSGPLAPGGMGAGRALLLQTAHPWVTASIDEHSIVRYDPMERARRTATNVSTIVYGSMPQVMRAAHKMHKTHSEIKGKIPYHAGAFHRNSDYYANEVNAMIWVHATLWETLVFMYEQLEEPLSIYEKNRFYEETKLFAMVFGIPESALPKDWNEFMEYNRAMWNSSQLTVTDNARTLKEDLFNPRSVFLMFPLWIQEVVTAANLPPAIREGYDMDYGTWEQFHNAWLMASAKLTQWMLPDYIGINSIHHEAEARLRGERVGYYHQRIIEDFLGTERLVN